MSHSSNLTVSNSRRCATGFPIGFALPFIPWYLHRRYPNSFWKSVSVPLILQGAIAPPQTPTNIIFSGFVASWIAQYWTVRHRVKWAEKYLYILSSALDAGTSTNALAIYVFLGSTKFVSLRCPSLATRLISVSGLISMSVGRMVGEQLNRYGTLSTGFVKNAFRLFLKLQTFCSIFVQLNYTHVSHSQLLASSTLRESTIRRCESTIPTEQRMTSTNWPATATSSRALSSPPPHR